ncbi:MAG TPA: glycosyltransferase family 1 protein [Draconibacterium sp.]|nr:glycosyltransferase family 1 protein [Draconibacterium sp.]
MRIGFDAKRAFLNASGLGNYSRNTINALYHYSKNNQFVLYTPEIKDGLIENYKQFEVHSPESSVAKIFNSVWRSNSAKLLKKHQIDIFHGLSNELPHGIHKTNIPAVVTIHDLIFMRFPEFYKTIDRKIYRSKVKYACSSARKIIAISEQTKEDIFRFFDVDPVKIEVVYQSVSPVFFEHENTENLRSKYNLSERFILSVGTHEPRKNQLSIIKAIHSEKIDIQLVIVGKSTSYTKKLIRFITENKMETQVKFLNSISEKDLAGLYQMASLSIYISFFEGFGLPVIESMASGCPVITSNVSCLPETAGGAAILCAPNDFSELGMQIKTLLENENLRNDLIQKGNERTRLFHPEYFAEKMISLYTGILS